MKPAPACHAMGWRCHNGLVKRHPVNTHIEEASDGDTEYENDDVREKKKKKKHRGVLSYSCKICLLGETLPKGFENIKISSLTAGTLALPIPGSGT